MSIKKQAVHIDCRWLASRITDYSSRGIALKVSELVHSGEIAPGSYLPPVRELAEQLGVSPASISMSWGILRKQRMLRGGRSQGVWISGISGPAPERTEQLGNFSGISMLDLAWVTSDPLLLPDLKQAIAEGTEIAELNSYQRIAILPELEKQARIHWPYPAESMLTTEGAFDGLNSILETMLLSGSVIAVAVPTPSLVLDMLDYFNVTIVPVLCDNQGPIPDSLEQALCRNPSAFIYQPRTNSITSYTVSEARKGDLVRVLRKSTALIIEHDTMERLSGAEFVSMGCDYPERTVHIVSYANAYGPDLRLAILSGPDVLLKRVHAFRNFRCVWNSRILQGALAWMLRDGQIQKQIADARQVYIRRRQALTGILWERGIKIDGQEGMSVWLEVPSEQHALVTLAARGIIAMPCSSCGETVGQYIRITTSCLKPEWIPRVAEATALAYYASSMGVPFSDAWDVKK
ncbi:MAG: aminotransferase class I/II-fold pyridoxal phosphate-dependent enzyme [Enterobacteriaceae bacterium]